MRSGAKPLPKPQITAMVLLGSRALPLGSPVAVSHHRRFPCTPPQQQCIITRPRCAWPNARSRGPLQVQAKQKHKSTTSGNPPPELQISFAEILRSGHDQQPLPNPPKSSTFVDVLPYLLKLALAEKANYWRIGTAFVALLVSKCAGRYCVKCEPPAPQTHARTRTHSHTHCAQSPSSSPFTGHPLDWLHPFRLAHTHTFTRHCPRHSLTLCDFSW